MIALNQQTYKHFKSLIVTHQLDDDAIYSEAKTAKSLGISRTPLHHAMLRFVQKGYLDILPSKGFCIHLKILETMENADLDHIYAVTLQHKFVPIKTDAEKYNDVL